MNWSPKTKKKKKKNRSGEQDEHFGLVNANTALKRSASAIFPFKLVFQTKQGKLELRFWLLLRIQIYSFMLQEICATTLWALASSCLLSEIV